MKAFVNRNRASGLRRPCGPWLFSAGSAALCIAFPAFLCPAFAEGDTASADTTGGALPMLSSEALKTPPDFFPIMPWDPLHGWSQPGVNPENGLDSMAECNFTMGGFVKAGDLQLAEILDLKVLMYPDVEKGINWTREWKKLTDDEIDARVLEMINQGGVSDAILGYFIMDEPGASNFPALAKVVAAVKKYAPGKLAYINLFPGYATIGAPDQSQLETASFSEYLERFVEEVHPQVISYDNYMVQYSMDLTKPETAARYFSDLLEVRRVALKYGLPFWNIVSSNQIRAQTTIPSPANLAFQAYTTLAAGGRGVTWYTYYSRGYGYAPIDKTGHRTLTWDYLKLVNHQVKTIGPFMNGLASTGVFFTAPALVEGLPLLPGRLIEQVDTENPMMVGEFEGEDGTDYVMVVNLSLQKSAKFVLKAGGNPLPGRLVSAADGSLSPVDNENGTWLVAGQGALIRLD